MNIPASYIIKGGCIEKQIICINAMEELLEQQMRYDDCYFLQNPGSGVTIDAITEREETSQMETSYRKPFKNVEDVSKTLNTSKRNKRSRKGFTSQDQVIFDKTETPDQSDEPSNLAKRKPIR